MDMRVDPLVADPALRRKLARLATGAAPRVVDLFAGCGGISLGFQRAGFAISGAVEIDPWAARSHAENFHGGEAKTTAVHARPRDMTTLEPDEFCTDLGLGATEDAVDILVGGPPCQAYARIGRAKLRDIADNPEAYKVDPRRDLYLRYIAWVDRLRPLAILIENVPDMLNQGGHNVAAEIVELLAGHGYIARYGLVNTAFYGVPQTRDRVFIIAYRRELGIVPELPKPTRHLELSQGYKGTRSVALKYVDLLCAGAYMSQNTDTSLPDPVTVEEAIGDLPQIDGDDVGRGPRRRGPETRMEYRAEISPSAFALDMRNWPGCPSTGIDDHFIRYLPRDGYIFQGMREGAEYPEAHRYAVKVFDKKVDAQGMIPNTDRWNTLRKSMVPPYRTDTFPNRWWKLVRDQPSRTLMAHLGKDCYSHIHYDGEQRRTISVREAARLQSFPDGFHFAGSLNPSMKQIGNAVPPVMAWEIAKTMKAALEAAVTRLDP